MPREESVEATPPASSGLRRLEDCGQLVGRGRLEDGSQGASLLSQGPQVQRNDGGGIVGNAFSQVGEQRSGIGTGRSRPARTSSMMALPFAWSTASRLSR